MSRTFEVRNQDGATHGWGIICPACDAADQGRYHLFVTDGSRGWSFDGNRERPTFSPSMHAKGHKAVCHSFVRDGRIEYLSDCTHAMAGQTIDLPEVDHD